MVACDELAAAEDRVLCAEALGASAYEPTWPGEVARAVGHLFQGNIPEAQIFAMWRTGAKEYLG